MKIYGASGHGKVIAEIFCELFEEEVEFVDDEIVSSFFNKNVLPPSKIVKNDRLIIGIGNNKIRKRIAENYPNQQYFALIHKNSYVSNSAILGLGTVVMSGVSINADAIIGNHVICNTNCSIDHDCKLGDFVHISPNVALAGGVQIGEGTQIGIGASVVQGIKIGAWAIIGAGAVILNDIPDFAVVVGVPGNIIKYNYDNER